MKTVEVFDRPLCCSTGVCGTTVDPTLVRFAADLAWLQGQGIGVRRFNLAHEPAAFLEHDDVKAALRAGQVQNLPLVRVDGQIVSQGVYPSREELAELAGVNAAPAREEARTCCSASCCC